MARNSLQYSFLGGESLWSDARKFVAVNPCRNDVNTMKLNSRDCRAFIEGSDKAKMQWKLEEEFRMFEAD